MRQDGRSGQVAAGAAGDRLPRGLTLRQSMGIMKETSVGSMADLEGHCAEWEGKGTLSKQAGDKRDGYGKGKNDG